ncbi:MAG: site-2 protease family protein [Planctomycetota bacterium]|nr:site-2 protease family protein [Planctomycetota bacterium]
MSLFSTGSNILLIIIGFGVLIFVHELGHFLAAKWAKIRTEGFCIGFGGAICSYRKGIGFRLGSTEEATAKRMGKPAIQCSDEELRAAGIGETEYALRMIPLGGYVRMLGQDDLDPGARSKHPRSFNAVSIGKRMVVISAGIIMNIITAVILFIAAFMSGVQFNAPVIGDVVPGEPAAGTDIRSGDTVVAVDGEPIRTFSDVIIAVAFSNPGEKVQFELRGAESDQTRTVEILPEMNPQTGLLGVGLTPASSTTLVQGEDAGALMQPTLEDAGLGATKIGPGWSITGVDGHPTDTWNNWAERIDASEGRPVSVTWTAPDGTTTEVDMVGVPELEVMRHPNPAPEDPTNYDPGLLGMCPLVGIKMVLPDSPNRAHLEPGDAILKLGTTTGPNDGDFRKILTSNPGRTLPALVLRAGQRVETTLSVNEQGQIGVLLTPELELPIISRTLPLVGAPTADAAPEKTPMAQLDLLPLTTILSVNSVPVTDWVTLRSALQAAARGSQETTAIEMEIENPTKNRERQTVTFTLSRSQATSLENLGWTPPLWMSFFEPLWTTLSAQGNPLTAVEMGFMETKKTIILTYLTMYRLVQGTVGVEQLRGPVGIVHLGSQVADRGIMYLLFFLAMISVNLAVLNFLPLPILDGGHFLYLVYEKFKGRPPSIAFQNGAALLGLLLIGSLFIIITYFDVTRLLG